MTVRFACCAAAMLASHAALAEETCRYSGTTSYSGRVVVETRAATENGDTTGDAAARVNAEVVRVDRLAIPVSGDRRLAGR